MGPRAVAVQVEVFDSTSSGISSSCSRRRSCHRRGRRRFVVAAAVIGPLVEYASSQSLFFGGDGGDFGMLGRHSA